MEQARRIAVVITARPSYARIKTALDALRDMVELDLIGTASALLERYGTVVDQMRADGFTVSRTLATQLDGDDPSVAARTMGLTTMDLAAHFASTRPDAVLTIADRSETLATAVAAAYQHLPLVHVQGGERTGSIDDKVRHAVTQLADLHLVSTEEAAARVRTMRPGAEVVVTGCPSLDLAATLDARPILSLPGTGDLIDLQRPFVLVLYHPVTDEAEEAGRHTRAIQQAVAAVGLPVVWFWPNVDHGSGQVAKQLRTWHTTHPTHFVRQIPPLDFLRLMRQSAVMVGNSSAGIREGSFLGVPVVNVGTRQAGRARGPNVIDVPPEAPAIRRAMHAWQQTHRPSPSTLYGTGQGGARIASALQDWLTGRSTARHVA